MAAAIMQARAFVVSLRHRVMEWEGQCKCSFLAQSTATPPACMTLLHAGEGGVQQQNQLITGGSTRPIADVRPRISDRDFLILIQVPWTRLLDFNSEKDDLTAAYGAEKLTVRHVK